MLRLAAAAVAIVLLQASPTLAGDPDRNLGGPSLNSSEIAAIQYHEAPQLPLANARRQFCYLSSASSGTACVVDGLPGFMLPGSDIARQD